MNLYTAGSVHAEIYQCRNSSERRGQIFTPNIPDMYFNPQNILPQQLEESMEGYTYIFPVPSQSAQGRNCSGDVAAFQYCYLSNNSNTNVDHPVFNLYFITVDDNRYSLFNGQLVQTTSSKVCSTISGLSAIYCCDVLSSSITLPPSSFTFGVQIQSGDARLLTFRPSSTDFNAQRSVVLDTRQPPEPHVVGPLLLLRFLIGKHISCPYWLNAVAMVILDRFFTANHRSTPDFKHRRVYSGNPTFY